MNKFFIYNLVFILLFATSSCASTSTIVDDFVKYQNDPQALRVVAQICVPNKTAYFDTLNVDVSDLPANLSRSQIQKLFQMPRPTGSLVRDLQIPISLISPIENIKQQDCGVNL